MGDLKPCPFCGGEAELFMDNYEKCGAYCLKCGLYLGVELECGTELRDGWKAMYDSKEIIKQRWNTRVPNISIPAARLQEICEAEGEGRLVVLPCKVGDTVVSTYGRSKEERDINQNDWLVTDWQIYAMGRCVKTITNSAMLFGAADWRKTVFRNREAAEAALKAGGK